MSFSIDALWDMFGEDRLIYGSNWPVSDRSGREYADTQHLVMTYFTARRRGDGEILLAQRQSRL